MCSVSVFLSLSLSSFLVFVLPDDWFLSICQFHYSWNFGLCACVPSSGVTLLDCRAWLGLLGGNGGLSHGQSGGLHLSLDSRV